MIKYFPVLATILMQLSSIGMIWDMFREQSAKGQSVFGWATVVMGLLLWETFYRIRMPHEKIALWMCRVSIVLDVIVLAVVLYFKN